MRWSSVSRASAAGVTWTSRTTSAPWAGRDGHTSVIDAAGTIYVIGGWDGYGTNTFYKDVWASTDGGADRIRAGGWSRGTSVLMYSWGHQGVRSGHAVGFSEGYSRGTHRT